MRCSVCPITHVPNSVFCDECGEYLLQGKELGTDPLEIKQLKWLGRVKGSSDGNADFPNSKSLTIRLHIGCNPKKGYQGRELQISLEKPIRLGRSDPVHDIFPEIDLTEDLGREYGISREHMCIYQQGNAIKIEDLGSTNGTLLNGERLDPYMPETVKAGDQFQLGKLLIEMSVVRGRP